MVYLLLLLSLLLLLVVAHSCIAARVDVSISQGGMIRLETRIALKLLNSSISSFTLLLKLYKQFSIEQFEPTASQSTVPSPLLALLGAGLREARGRRPAADTQRHRNNVQCRCQCWCQRQSYSCWFNAAIAQIGPWIARG